LEPLGESPLALRAKEKVPEKKSAEILGEFDILSIGLLFSVAPYVDHPIERGAAGLRPRAERAGRVFVVEADVRVIQLE
jgi:hypothetical protein